ncbi:MAG: hypothetical protein WB511_12880 [Nitrososphaeraceae archaeon]
MNKFNLFLLIGIGAVVGTASIFGSIVIPALAQGNTTEEVETGPPLILKDNMSMPTNNTTEVETGPPLILQPPGNMSMPTNNMSNMTTATDNTSVAGVPQNEEQTTDNGEQTTDNGDDNGEQTTDNGDDNSDNGEDEN